MLRARRYPTKKSVRGLNLGRWWQYTYNVSDWISIGSRTISIFFINLIIHKKVVLVVLVKDPSLMSVCSTLVGSAGDDLGGILVGDVVAGIFVSTQVFIFISLTYMVRVSSL